MKIISGSSCPELAKAIANNLLAEYVEAQIKVFADGELSVRIPEKLSNEEIVIVQSTSPPVNNNLMELLLLVDTAKNSGAKKIIVIIPYFGYGRGSRKFHDQGPISAKLVAKLLEAAGVDQVITVELHSNNIKDFFQIPIYNIDPVSLFTPVLKTKNNFVIVSPDKGGRQRAGRVSELLGVELAIITKLRPKDNECNMVEIHGDVEEKNCLIIDDIVDTGGTICKASELLIANGALSVECFITHAVLSNDAPERLQASPISNIYVTDTINFGALPAKFQVIKVSELLSAALSNRIIMS